MLPCNFIFDIVATHFDAPKEKIDDRKQLLVEVTFNEITVPISSSRINVTEFKTGTGTEMKVEPEKLRQNLEKNGMPIVAKYTDRILGTGIMSFPKMITERIDEDMKDIMHVDTCKIENNGEPVGTVELLCRLIIKCDEHPRSEVNENRNNLPTSINSQDILFVMSDDQSDNTCDPCYGALGPVPCKRDKRR